MFLTVPILISVSLWVVDTSTDEDTGPAFSSIGALNITFWVISYHVVVRDFFSMLLSQVVNMVLRVIIGGYTRFSILFNLDIITMTFFEKLSQHEAVSSGSESQVRPLVWEQEVRISQINFNVLVTQFFLRLSLMANNMSVSRTGEVTNYLERRPDCRSATEEEHSRKIELSLHFVSSLFKAVT